MLLLTISMRVREGNSVHLVCLLCSDFGDYGLFTNTVDLGMNLLKTMI